MSRQKPGRVEVPDPEDGRVDANLLAQQDLVVSVRQQLVEIHHQVDQLLQLRLAVAEIALESLDRIKAVGFRASPEQATHVRVPLSVMRVEEPLPAEFLAASAGVPVVSEPEAQTGEHHFRGASRPLYLPPHPFKFKLFSMTKWVEISLNAKYNLDERLCEKKLRGKIVLVMKTAVSQICQKENLARFQKFASLENFASLRNVVTFNINITRTGIIILILI